MAYKIVYKVDDFNEFLKKIALQYSTVYKNIFPYNLGYYNSNGKWSFDCWNLVKAVLSGWQPNKTVGSYQKINGNGCGIGDWDGWTILNQCASVSTDWNNVPKGAFILTFAKDHAGVYVGDFEYNGKTYNVIECTPIWNNGVQASYVDNQGYRRRYKGDKYNYARWWWHGKLPWVDYSAKANPTPTPSTDPFPGVSDEELAKRVWAGEFGNGEARKKALGSRYTAVQALVDKGVGKPASKVPYAQYTDEQLAKMVWQGKFGTGAARMQALGSRYAAVQALVNKGIGR